MVNKYLLKIGSQLKIVPSKQLEAFSLNEALAIAICSLEEQKKQLMQDALTGEKYYYGHKIVESLELSLSKLEEKFPTIRQQIKLLTVGNNSVN